MFSIPGSSLMMKIEDAQNHLMASRIKQFSFLSRLLQRSKTRIIIIERQVGWLALLHQLSELLHAKATIFVEVKPAEDSVYLAGVKLLGYLKNQLFNWQGSLQYLKWVTRKTFSRRVSVADQIFLLFCSVFLQDIVFFNHCFMQYWKATPSICV